VPGLCHDFRGRLHTPPDDPPLSVRSGAPSSRSPIRRVPATRRAALRPAHANSPRSLTPRHDDDDGCTDCTDNCAPARVADRDVKDFRVRAQRIGDDRNGKRQGVRALGQLFEGRQTAPIVGTGFGSRRSRPPGKADLACRPARSSHPYQRLAVARPDDVSLAIEAEVLNER